MGVKIVTPSATLDAGQKIEALKVKIEVEKAKRLETEKRLASLEEALGLKNK
ncbi:hypothetical protein [Selenomonas sp. AE3005]|uniref:hypothetical protein n=1 Tax=Selenomonas sp. AE3005 TaxID=1485543 RepID=UPI0025E3B6E5|nr:hypothetical protein [Selenomonas sp. AE3005]